MLTGQPVSTVLGRKRIKQHEEFGGEYLSGQTRVIEYNVIESYSQITELRELGIWDVFMARRNILKCLIGHLNTSFCSEDQY